MSLFHLVSFLSVTTNALTTTATASTSWTPTTPATATSHPKIVISVEISLQIPLDSPKETLKVYKTGLIKLVRFLTDLF